MSIHLDYNPQTKWNTEAPGSTPSKHRKERKVFCSPQGAGGLQAPTGATRGQRGHSGVARERRACPAERAGGSRKSAFPGPDHLPPDPGSFLAETKKQQNSQQRAGVGADAPLHRPTPWDPLTLRELGTREVNSLIETVQNPNFAEWQFGGKKKKTPAMGKC